MAGFGARRYDETAAGPVARRGRDQAGSVNQHQGGAGLQLFAEEVPGEAPSQFAVTAFEVCDQRLARGQIGSRNQDWEQQGPGSCIQQSTGPKPRHILEKCGLARTRSTGKAHARMRHGLFEGSQWDTLFLDSLCLFSQVLEIYGWVVAAGGHYAPKC